MAVISSKQSVCRWLLKHQHKLKQSIRACSLQVKEVAPIEEIPNDEHDFEFTFKSKDLKIELSNPAQLRRKPEVSELKFGHIFTDHMLKIYYHEKISGWQKPCIIPFENIQLHPAARVLHYAVELFEGSKVYRGVDGKIRWFRPNLNMIRMNRSATMIGLPNFDGDELIKCINRLIQIDQEWVPQSEKASLYIRPTLIGIDGTLGVAKSESSLLYVILSPVGSYWADGKSDAVALYADPRFARAWPGGCGSSKLGSNYAPTIRIQSDAQKRGLQQVLWLYGPENYITEVGTMNIFIIYKDSNGDKVMVTPPLNDLILPGVIRDSVLALGMEWKEFKIEQRMVSMKELIHLQKQERLLEMFGAGTACIITPVASIEFMGDVITIPTTQQQNPIYRKLRDHLSAIQYGHIDHPWGMVIN